MRAKKKSPREGLYIDAVAAFFTGGDAGTKFARDKGYKSKLALTMIVAVGREVAMFVTSRSSVADMGLDHHVRLALHRVAVGIRGDMPIEILRKQRSSRFYANLRGARHGSWFNGHAPARTDFLYQAE
jgi:hypothetical protein